MHAQFNTPAPVSIPAVTLADKSPAFRFGYEDGQTHQPFAPEAYFSGDYQMSSYCLGFLSAAPDNIIACDWWTKFIAADELAQEAARADDAAIRHSTGA